jgi:hypothetical protein
LLEGVAGDGDSQDDGDRVGGRVADGRNLGDR